MDFQFPKDLTEELYGHYYGGYEESKRDLPTFGKKKGQEIKYEDFLWYYNTQ